MTLYSDTKLETADYNLQNWEKIYNKNIELLNDNLLKLHALLDVNVNNLKDGQILVWNTAQGKWVPRTYILA